MIRLSRVLPLLAGALIFASCADDPVVPQPTVFGTYRLESVGGLPLPIPTGSIVDGGLLLRTDGTFEFIARGRNGFVYRGSYDPLNGAFVVAADSNSFYPKNTQGIGRLIGDSIRLRILAFSSSIPGVSQDSVTWVLRKVATEPVAVKEGTYVLKALNDRPAPFVTESETFNGIRYVTQIDYDTLVFRDGYFFYESRSVSSRSDDGGSASSNSFGTVGLYGGNSGVIKLRSIGGSLSPSQVTEHDSLYVNGTALMRKLITATTIFQERYERVK